ncbi:hypothetical protein ACEW7V_02695 [Areca yellow leaf disease phytoplasma]|uniref:hypothetical protein n=1 Tax=Areca yellow leaf disease phytoplasma TaxID=927614 RepID=UPI0035B56BAF
MLRKILFLKQILDAQGSILTNKYAEGYPQARYYNGCKNVDQIEKLPSKEQPSCLVLNIQRQPHSGSQANMGAFQALLKPGDKILGLSLMDGGHLTHGHKLSFSGGFYEAHFYNVNPQTEMIDYDEIRKVSLKLNLN